MKTIRGVFSKYKKIEEEVLVAPLASECRVATIMDYVENVG